jgi:hypothetical protein
MEERIQKILSQWGIASRRQAEEMIKLGRVRCNGAIVELGHKADPSRDAIEVDGKPLRSPHRPQPIYLLLNKPTGVVTTCDDPQGRPTVMQLLPPNLRQGQGIHPVGRLDTESTGALLLTNDGTLTDISSRSCGTSARIGVKTMATGSCFRGEKDQKGTSARVVSRCQSHVVRIHFMGRQKSANSPHDRTVGLSHAPVASNYNWFDSTRTNRRCSFASRLLSFARKTRN